MFGHGTFGTVRFASIVVAATITTVVPDIDLDELTTHDCLIQSSALISTVRMSVTHRER